MACRVHAKVKGQRVGVLLLSVTLGTELRSSVLGARTWPAELSCCPQTLDY